MKRLANYKAEVTVRQLADVVGIAGSTKLVSEFKMIKVWNTSSVLRVS